MTIDVKISPILTRKEKKCEGQALWQQQQAQGFRQVAELLTYLALSADKLGVDEQSLFPLRVPRPFADKMVKGDADDPLLRQILPLLEERFSPPGFSTNPVGDNEAQRGPGLIQKYRGRALLMTTSACGVHCRYCFRRHYPYTEQVANPSAWTSSVKQLAEDTSISEVILSGGDPLSLSDEKLGELITQLDAIPHLKRLRIHTRQPVVIPARITDEFCERLANTRLQTVIVIHANHANEICDQLVSRLKQLHHDSGAQLLNQSVLLKGVNDSVTALVNLSERLFECQVLPYYLHLLDRVEGGAHFEVNEMQANQLIKQVRKYLPGYLVPQLVREIAGEPSKTPVNNHNHNHNHNHY